MPTVTRGPPKWIGFSTTLSTPTDVWRGLSLAQGNVQVWRGGWEGVEFLFGVFGLLV